MSAADRGWGPGWPNCDRTNVVTLVAGRLGLRLPVRAEVAPLFSRMIDELELARGTPFRPDWSWGGACRAIAGTSTPSNHSRFTAIDLDAPDNPYLSRAKHARHPGARLYPGGLVLISTMPQQVEAIAKKYGMRWGGNYFTKPDPMHFEFMGTPEDAARIERETRPGAAPGPVPPPPAPPAPTPEETDMWWLIKGDARPEWWLFDGSALTHITERDDVAVLAMMMGDKLDCRREKRDGVDVFLPHEIDQGFINRRPRSIHDFTLALDMRVRYLQGTVEAAHPFSPVAMDPETGRVVDGVETAEEAKRRRLIWCDPMIPRLLALYAAGPGTGNGG